MTKYGYQAKSGVLVRSSRPEAPHQSLLAFTVMSYRLWINHVLGDLFPSRAAHYAEKRRRL